MTSTEVAPERELSGLEELPPEPPEAGRPARRPPLGLALGALVVGLAFAAPLAYLAWRNLTLGSDLTGVLFSSDTLEPLARTVWLGGVVALSTVVVGTGLAWLTTRTDLPAAGLWRVLAPLPLVFPSFVGAIALITAFAPGGLLESMLEPLGFDQLPTIEGFRGSWFVLTLFTYPLVYLPVAARLRTLPPSLEESARLLGRGPWEAFRTIVLPQTQGAISAGALLVFLYVLSDFGVVQLMRYDTLTRVIFENQLARQDVAFASALVLGVLAVVVVAVERQVNRRRLQIEVARGRSPLVVPLRRWRWPACALVALLLAGALVGPVLSLGYWVWRDLGDAASPLSRLGGDLRDLSSPALSTAGVSVVAAIVAVIVVLPVAYLATRYRSRVAGTANALVVAGFALPGLAIALALAFWTLRTPGLEHLYQTVPVLIVAYVIHFGAQAMRAAQVAVGGIPRNLEDAGRSLGAGRLRRFATIELPLMRGGLVAGAGLVMLSVMKELPATLLLAPSWFETLATEIWKAQEFHSFAQMGLASLVLVAVSGILTWLLVVRRADHLH